MIVRKYKKKSFQTMQVQRIINILKETLNSTCFVCNSDITLALQMTFNCQLATVSIDFLVAHLFSSICLNLNQLPSFGSFLCSRVSRKTNSRVIKGNKRGIFISFYESRRSNKNRFFFSLARDTSHWKKRKLLTRPFEIFHAAH